MISFTFNSLLVSLCLLSLARATNVHCNDGCILVAGVAVCHPNSVPVAGGAATIFARFDGNNHDSTNIPGCQLNAQWNPNFGDIFFGDDNCLYDATGANIDGQCCNVGTGGSTRVKNPYN
ncbi:hypothetical protein B0H11DRAFT_2381973 [Mycena galericulata]|nr:hypothetical protein B0H11DRAFT_2393676 [Mycena galericulata]KAJ7432109.1 hypothetical protein B0H11DRAFT_2381973 [Mycena galericulata]